MGIKFSERFESHMDGIDAGTKGDAKKIEDVEEDSYDDGFDEKLSDALSESTDAGVDDNDAQDTLKKSDDTEHISRMKKADRDGITDAKGSGKLPTEPGGAMERDARKDLSEAPATDVHSYTMNTTKTIELMREQMDDEGKAYFDSQIDAGGGVDGQRAHLRGVGYEYFMTSSADKKASGNFLTEESPGETPSERKENLQLPPENEASDVDKVVSKKPTIVLTSEIAPQEEWAAQSGYEAKEGMKQVFTPNLNKGGAIGAGIYEIEQSEEDAESKDIDGVDETKPEKGKP